MKRSFSENFLGYLFSLLKNVKGSSGNTQMDFWVVVYVYVNNEIMNCKCVWG